MPTKVLPSPRPQLWPLRPRESASVSQTTRAGRTVVTIEHAPLRGVTAEMLSWWYRHVPGTMTYAGQTYDDSPTVRRTPVVRLENEFSTTADGARYVTRMTLGDTRSPARHLLNPIAHRRAMPPAKRTKWIRHHIEEIGNLENFLPDLFRNRADDEP